MQILELDAGNTRIKWRIKNADTASTQNAAEEVRGVVQAVAGEAGFEMLQNQLKQATASLHSGNDIACIKEARFCSVRTRGFNKRLAELLHEFSDSVSMARVNDSQAGVKNSYLDVGALGCDRWLALLAAFRKAEGACCVVDCGSALTVDLLDAKGCHIGGYIVPGIQLMQNGMADKSRSLALEDIVFGKLLPGTDTRSAIGNGITLTIAGLLGYIRDHQAGDEFQWYLTGGDGQLVCGLLDWKHEFLPELVLDGLSLSQLESC